MPPEYYEYVRLRDVYMRDLAGLTTMIETLKAQRPMLHTVTARQETTEAVFTLTKTINHLTALYERLMADMIEARENADRIVRQVQGL